jgi:tRNA-splicing ligase RtcB
MPIALELTGGRVPVKVWTPDLEPEARRQLENVSRLPIIHGHVAAMPDVHAGIGATVGSVIPTKGAIIPAAVGVDVGCGLHAVQLSLTAKDMPDSLRTLRSAIESAVPVGFDFHAGAKGRGGRREKIGKSMEKGLRNIVERNPRIATMQKNFEETWVRQLGTLGGGNHFIEVCLDETQNVWVMLHSGSRGIGNVIGRYFIERARREMERSDTRLPDRDLAWFAEGSPAFDEYVDAVHWAQDYALENRREMMRSILAAIEPHLPPFRIVDEAIECHHNYVARETHFGENLLVTRKGAIRAGAGELGIIPGSMGAKSFIVRGKGNPDSFCSCAHGAGRLMSRTEAKRRFSQADVERQTSGVECRKDAGVIDEIPGAYKPIDEVMANQTDLVDVVHTLKQVVCVKG